MEEEFAYAFIYGESMQQCFDPWGDNEGEWLSITAIAS